jgi:hypothetical protein
MTKDSASPRKGDVRNAADVLDDDELAPLLSPGFNRTEFATKALGDRSVSVPMRTERLKQSAQKLQDAIHYEVTSRQDELLTLARRLQTSKNSLQHIKQLVNGLSSTTHRLRRDVREPFDIAQQQAVQLENLHRAIELLRCVNHRLKQTTKLRQVMGSERANLESMDFAKAARFLWDIESYSPETSVEGVDVVSRFALLVYSLGLMSSLFLFSSSTCQTDSSAIAQPN